MVLLGDVGDVEARFSPFRGSVNLDGDVVKWRLISVRLEIVLTSTQDRCPVCAKCTIGLEISFDAPDGTPRLRG